MANSFITNANTISTANSVIYENTVANKQTALTALVLSNRATNPISYSISLDNVAAGSSTYLIRNGVLNVGEYIEFPNLIVAYNWRISGVCNTSNGLSIAYSGIERNVAPVTVDSSHLTILNSLSVLSGSSGYVTKDGDNFTSRFIVENNTANRKGINVLNPGGGSANTQIGLNISDLDEEITPDSSNYFIPVYNLGEDTNQKLSLTNMLSLFLVEGVHLKVSNSIHASLSNISLSTSTIQTLGFTNAGDGGGAYYQRVDNEPSHEGKFQSADGYWWELLDEYPVYPEMLGAKGDWTIIANGTNDATSLQKWLNLPLRYETKLRSRAYYTANTLVIPAGRAISGQPIGFESNNMFNTSTFSGSLIVSDLAADLNANNEPNNSILVLNRDCQINNLSIYWHGQPTANTGWIPISTPWAIKVGNWNANGQVQTEIAKSVSASSVGIFAFTHGINMFDHGQSSEWTNIYGQMFKVGMRIDCPLFFPDPIKVNSVKFHPMWVDNEDINSYSTNNFIGIDFGRAALIAGDLYIKNAKWAVNMGNSKSGPADIGRPLKQFYIKHIQAENSITAVRGQPSSSGVPLRGVIGTVIMLAKSYFAGSEDWTINIETPGSVHVNRFEYFGNAKTGGHARLAPLTGAGNLSFDSVRLCRWDLEGNNIPAFKTEGTTARLKLHSSPEIFMNNGSSWFTSNNRIYLGDNTRGEANIETSYRFKVDMVGNYQSITVPANNINFQVHSYIYDRPFSEGAREVRVLAKTNANVISNVSIFAEDGGQIGTGYNLGHMFTTTAAGIQILDSGWKTIWSPTPYTANSMGNVYCRISNSGVGTLNFTQMVMMFR